jgi:D-alanine-D-alanine ligase-like ATP-grasp enzyme
MKTLRRVLYAWVDRNFLGGCSSYNTLATRKSCRSKRQAREVFAHNGIPHARGEIFYGMLAPFRFARKYGFPLVVKPNVGGFSRGSHFPITTYGELLKAVLLVKIWWPSSVIEQYLEGRNYRIVVVKDGIMSAIRRYPPFIVGDGHSTIAALNDRENEIRREMNLYPVMHPLRNDSRTARYLGKKKLSLSSVPEDGELVRLHNRISLAAGGVVEILDKKTIHPQNLQLFLQIPSLFHANILGIDAIFEKGIEYSHNEQRVILLEVNSRPYLKMHDYPRYGKQENLRPYLEKLESLDIGERDIF